MTDLDKAVVRQIVREELAKFVAEEVERQLAQLPREVLTKMIAEEIRKQLTVLPQQLAHEAGLAKPKLHKSGE